ncbi:MAG: putative TIM-barrel fold metal-dependent hydrolase [Gammaproteobacteria bacterium]|jgi:predicted TIM-barrel fold metal-dependent hydrolase
MPCVTELVPGNPKVLGIVNQAGMLAERGRNVRARLKRLADCPDVMVKLSGFCYA